MRPVAQSNTQRSWRGDRRLRVPKFAQAQAAAHTPHTRDSRVPRTCPRTQRACVCVWPWQECECHVRVSGVSTWTTGTRTQLSRHQRCRRGNAASSRTIPGFPVSCHVLARQSLGMQAETCTDHLQSDNDQSATPKRRRRHLHAALRCR